MISLSLKALAEILGIGAPAAEPIFTGVTIDSRKPCEGQLFVALAGANFDGHDFVDAAYRGGAVAALVEKPVDSDIAQLQVENSIDAMARLANYWRHHCDPLVIALTGSNGKTTVKEMLTRILAAEASTHATRGNLNNEIGVPLTLFELEPGHRYAIIEMGANHRGEIAALARIAEPDIVYVNNAGAAHLEGFGGLQGVVEGKGELYAYCSSEQRALFNLDEPACETWRRRCAARTTLTCALDREADLGARWSTRNDGIEVAFHYGGETSSAELEVLGEHNVRNAVAAVGLALLAGVELRRAVTGLTGFSGVKGRLQPSPGPAGSRLIDDSYNANPGSLIAAIKVLCALDGSPWIALGDMRELGDDAAELHRDAGRTAREHGVEKLFAVGDMSCLASRELGEAGYCCDSIDAMADAILAQIHPAVNLLVKGSRAAGMERLIELLTRSVNRGEADAV